MQIKYNQHLLSDYEHSYKNYPPEHHLAITYFQEYLLFVYYSYGEFKHLQFIYRLKHRIIYIDFFDDFKNNENKLFVGKESSGYLSCNFKIENFLDYKKLLEKICL